MKKEVVGLIAMAVAVSVQAKDIKPINVDCGTVNVELSNAHSEIHPIVTWDGGSKFPNPPNPKKINGTPYSFSCPNLSSSYDGDVFRMKAPDYEQLEIAMRGGAKYPGDRIIRFYDHTDYVYPNIMRGRIPYVHWINLNTHKVTINNVLTSTKEVVVGYRVNNGELKPLHYNGEFSDYQDDLKRADVLDVYYSYKDKKFGKKNMVERIHLDKPNGELALYKSFKFPQK